MLKNQKWSKILVTLARQWGWKTQATYVQTIKEHGRRTMYVQIRWESHSLLTSFPVLCRQKSGSANCSRVALRTSHGFYTICCYLTHFTFGCISPFVFVAVGVLIVSQSFVKHLIVLFLFVAEEWVIKSPWFIESGLKLNLVIIQSVFESVFKHLVEKLIEWFHWVSFFAFTGRLSQYFLFLSNSDTFRLHLFSHHL